MIVGAQWGDEGKGKIVDLLAQDSDLVCRYQGGPNAGHTVVVGERDVQDPADPDRRHRREALRDRRRLRRRPGVLIAELDELEARGHETEGLLFVSGNAHLVMPWHVALDGARERRLGRLQIGTTRRGIGPAYADKATRIGIRVQDLLDPKILRQKLELAVAEKNVWLAARVRARAVRRRGGRRERSSRFAERLAPYVADTSLLVDRACATASACCSRARRARCSTSITARTRSSRRRARSPQARRSASASARTASTRCSASRRRTSRASARGRSPARSTGPTTSACSELGHEFGTVTGRERRCGWLDLVALALRGPRERDHLARADEARRPVRVLASSRCACATGSRTVRDRGLPAHQSDFHHCRPVFETLPGWGAHIDAELPDAARAYVTFVEEALGVPVTLVGTGAAREHVLALG